MAQPVPTLQGSHHNLRPAQCYKSLLTFAKDALRANQGQAIKGRVLSYKIHKNGSAAATRNFSETSMKHKMLRIEPRLA
jgi:hypothetical protein